MKEIGGAGRWGWKPTQMKRVVGAVVAHASVHANVPMTKAANAVGMPVGQLCACHKCCPSA